MQRRTLLALVSAALALPAAAMAQDAVKIGLILPMTGPFASTGRQVDAAVKLYLAEHGDTVAGKKVEVILKDDAGVAPTRRAASRRSWWSTTRWLCWPGSA